MPKNNVFISYARIDEGFARQIASLLSKEGLSVWIDVEDIPAGERWSNAIQQGLDKAEVMLLIVTPESMASKNVADEWMSSLTSGCTSAIKTSRSSRSSCVRRKCTTA